MLPSGGFLGGPMAETSASEGGSTAASRKRAFDAKNKRGKAKVKAAQKELDAAKKRFDKAVQEALAGALKSKKTTKKKAKKKTSRL